MNEDMVLTREKDGKVLNQKQVSRVAEILKTIGHPIRLNILQLLDKEEALFVSDIQQKLPLKIEQSLLSHHLIKMKDNGVLSCEKNGIYVKYSSKDGAILHIFECMKTCNIVK